MARLFISYKHEEHAYAFALRQWLIDKQDWPAQDVFVDRDRLHAGDEWANKIFREAETSEAMLFLASEASLKPDSFCYKELQRARGVTIAVTLGGLSPDDLRLKSALPHGADARQITALDGQPTDAFSYVSPVDGSHGVVALNRAQVESIGQILRDLGIAPNSFKWKVTSDGPYRGLGALQEGDEALFFGREREIRDCIRTLEEVRQSVSDRAFLIQAPSGAGKSSLLRAGLWKRLRRHAGFTPLAIVRARQGILSHEEWGLAAGLAKPEANILNLPLGVLEERIANDLSGLLLQLADADASSKGGRRTLLLGIDQAEEMAALSGEAELSEFRSFFAGLTKVTKSLDLRLVLTARDDSIDATLGRLSASGIPHEAVRLYRLHRMPPVRFKDIIEKPARVAEQCGFPLKFDEVLATSLAQAAAQNQGKYSDALPILALALQRLVKKRRAPDGSILAEPEHASALVSDAVSEATGEALEAVGANDTALKQLMIPRLVTWDPRSGEGGAAKRRVATSSELFSGERSALRPLAGALVDQRLLTCAGDYYEVSHEALLRVAPLGNLLLELRGKFVQAEMLAMEARDWIDSGRRIEWVGRTGERLQNARSLLEDQDFGFVLTDKDAGVSSYLDACAEKDLEEREMRERLDRYQLASIASERRREQRIREPLPPSVAGDRAMRDHLGRVYISSSRQDLRISEEIREALTAAGFEITRDFEDIMPGEEWKHRLGELIKSADTIVLVLSPNSAASHMCMWELDEARRLGKRVIPVLVGEVPPSSMPSTVRELNLIFMRGPSEFDNGIDALVEALSTDIAWLREHTRLLERAMEWDQAGRPDNRLFSGSDIVDARRWLEHRPPNAPTPTELHRDFISASEVAEALRLSEARERADVYARIARRTTLVMKLAVLFAVTASGTAYFAFLQRNQVVIQRQVAIKERSMAEQQQQEAEKHRRLALEYASRVDELQKEIARIQKAAPATSNE